MNTLAEIAVQALEFLCLSQEPEVDSRIALREVESIFEILSKATAEERAALQQAALERLDWLMRDPDEYGYTPRKTVDSEHRQLLEAIASGSALHNK